MAPGDAWRRPSVSGVDRRLFAWGVTTMLFGILAAFLVDPPTLRLAGSITPIAIGFSLMRLSISLE